MSYATESLSKITKVIKIFTIDHELELVTAVEVSGVMASCYLFAQGKTKAEWLYQNEYAGHELTPKNEKAIILLRSYWPGLIAMSGTIGLIVFKNYSTARKLGALATVTSIAQESLRDYKDEVLKEVGEKKYQKIEENVAKKQVENTFNNYNQSNITLTGKGNTLFYDEMSGRYFRSDINKVREAFADIDDRRRNDDYASLNDLYDLLGVSTIRLGDVLGWESIDLGPTHKIEYSLIAGKLPDDSESYLAIVLDTTFSYPKQTDFRNVF